MNRKIYISDGVVSLAEYIPLIDDEDYYNCWSDIEVERAYNSKMIMTLEEFKNRKWKQRFTSTIIKCDDNTSIGTIMVSPIECEPDLAIMLYPNYRDKGYGTKAFKLGIKYCFEVLKVDHIFAGCFEHNERSKKMLINCGFIQREDLTETEISFETGKLVRQFDYELKK